LEKNFKKVNQAYENHCKSVLLEAFECLKKDGIDAEMVIEEGDPKPKIKEKICEIDADLVGKR